MAGTSPLGSVRTGGCNSWGGNTYGELGNGSVHRAGEATPVRVEAPEGARFVSIAAGIGTPFALADNGVTL